jgi:hypothetical protein
MSDAGQQAGGGQQQQQAGDGQQQQQQSGGEKPWFDALDTETKGYIQNRGLDKGDAVAAFMNASKAHREAATKLGIPADRVVQWPTKSRAEDPNAWADINARLGVGTKPEDYDFTDVKADEAFKAQIRDLALKNNLPKDTAKSLLTELAASQAKAADDAAKAHEAGAAAALASLKKEWGYNFNANTATAKSVAEKIGIKPEAIIAWEKDAGTIAVMEGLLKIGQAMGEDVFITSPVTGNVMSREQATARKAELMKDKAFGAKWVAKDAEAVKEMADLDRIISFGLGAPPGVRA